MLEDIRNHSPLPQQQEIEWMNARPFRATARVAALAVTALVTATAIVELQQPPQAPLLAHATGAGR